HDRRRLLRVRPGPHLEIVVGRLNAEIPEERVRHLGIVVLAGVHDDVLDPRAHGECAGERSEFHEVRSRADDREDHFNSCTTPKMATGRDTRIETVRTVLSLKNPPFLRGTTI